MGKDSLVLTTFVVVVMIAGFFMMGFGGFTGVLVLTALFAFFGAGLLGRFVLLRHGGTVIPMVVGLVFRHRRGKAAEAQAQGQHQSGEDLFHFHHF